MSQLFTRHCDELAVELNDHR